MRAERRIAPLSSKALVFASCPGTFSTRARIIFREIARRIFGRALRGAEVLLHFVSWSVLGGARRRGRGAIFHPVARTVFGGPLVTGCGIFVFRHGWGCRECRRKD